MACQLNLKVVLVVRECVLPICNPTVHCITLIVKETGRGKAFSLHAFATILLSRAHNVQRRENQSSLLNDTKTHIVEGSEEQPS